MQRHLTKLLLMVLSAGWILPLWLSAHATLDFLRVEVMPRLSGQEPAVNSFPYQLFIAQTLTITGVWLALAIGFWAWRLAGLPKEQTKGSLKSLGNADGNH